MTINLATIDLAITPLRSRGGLLVSRIEPDAVCAGEFNVYFAPDDHQRFHRADGTHCFGRTEFDLEFVTQPLCINMTDTYYTRDGQSARVLCTDNTGSFPVVALIDTHPFTFTAEGRVYVDGSNSEFDLQTKAPKSLPNLPSELIRVALADLAIVEANPKYKIDMGAWHEPGATQCSVCFAGAVMSMSLDTPVDLHRNPASFPSDVKDKLYALDSLRRGYALEGLRRMKLTETRDIPNFPVTDYAISSIRFRSDMTKFAAYLELLSL